jgi:hypothetical protein
MEDAVFATGYSPGVIIPPCGAVSRETSASRSTDPSTCPNAGAEQMRAALEKYQHFTKAQFPTLFQDETWAPARPDDQWHTDRRAQSDESRRHQEATQRHEPHREWVASEAHGLRDELRAQPGAAMRLGASRGESGFVPTSSQPVCGTDIKGTSAPSSPSTGSSREDSQALSMQSY